MGRAADTRRAPLGALLLLLPSLSACAATDFPPELVRFTEGPEVLRPLGAGTWEAGFRERGYLLREEDGYHLFYTGIACARCPGQLGYARSADGLAFERPGTAPVYAASPLEDVTVLRQGDTYYLFGEGASDELQLLTSTDRVTWRRQGRVDVRDTRGAPISRGPYGTPAVYYEDGVWYLFYERLDDGIWLATSRDLVTFRNVQDHPVIALGPGIFESVRVGLNQVLRYGGRYYAIYHGQGSLPQWSVHIAVSDDLVHWAKYARNPILPISDDHASAMLLQEGDRFRLYTMGGRVEVHFGEAPIP